MNLKKIIAILISICLISGSVLFVNAQTSLVVKLSNAEVASGEEFEIDLSLENNPGIAGVTLSFDFDNTVIKPISFENKSSFTALTTVDSKDIDLDSLNSINVTYDSMNDINTNGVIGTFRFKAVDNIDTTVTAITWTSNYLQASVWNENLDDVAYTTVSGEVTVSGNKSIDSSSTTVSTTTKSTETTTESTTITTTETTTEATTKVTTEATTKATTEATTKATTETTTKATTTVSETTTESTTVSENDTETTTETTTTVRHTGGGGGGSSSSSVITATTTTTESTTESVTEESSEETTESVISNDVKVTIGSKKVVIGNKTHDMDVAPYIQSSSNSTLVPLRFVALAICGEDVEKADTSSNVKWDAETKTATVSAGSKVIKFTAGSDTMIVDSKSIVMDNGVKAEISNNRMFIPFRALGQALGVSVDWDSDTKTAVYKTN